MIKAKSGVSLMLSDVENHIEGIKIIINGGTVM